MPFLSLYFADFFPAGASPFHLICERSVRPPGLEKLPRFLISIERLKPGTWFFSLAPSCVDSLQKNFLPQRCRRSLDMLMKERSLVILLIEELKKQGVDFIASEFAMKQRKIEKSQMISSTNFVEAGLIEIVSKQEKGWSYIKSGF